MRCLHPDKVNPTSWRLQIKAIGVQEYFPFNKYGSQERALLALNKREKQLAPRLRAKQLRAEIPFNQVFDDRHNLKGLSISSHVRDGLVIKMQLTVNGQQCGTTRRVNSKDLIDIFLELAAWRMAKLYIAPSREITQQLRKSFRLFEARYKRYLADRARSK